MKHFFFLIISIVMLESCKAQVQAPFKMEDLSKDSTAGLGFLDATRLGIHSSVALYASPEASTPFDTIAMVERTSGDRKGSYQITTNVLKDRLVVNMSEGDSEEQARARVQSGLTGRDPRLVFRVVSRSQHTFQVVVNEQTNQTAFIKLLDGSPLFSTKNEFRDSKAEDAVLLETWETMLNAVRFIQLQKTGSPSDGLLYDKPNGQVKQQLKLADLRSYYFRAVNVQGEWIEVAPNLEYRQDQNPNVSGWVRWIDGKKVLVLMIRDIYQ